MKQVEKCRLSLCPSLIPSGSRCGKGLLAHKKGGDNIKTAFSIQRHKFPPMCEIRQHVKGTLANLNMETLHDSANSGDSSKLKLCSPLILSLFVALTPLNAEGWGLTPGQPSVHSRPGVLSQDLLTPAPNNRTYIEHIAEGKEKEGGTFRNPIEIILYSMDANHGAPIYPMEILESTRYRQTSNSRANHIVLDHIKQAYTSLVDAGAALTEYLPEHLQDKTDEPVIWFLALLAASQKKYNGLASDHDWLSMLSILSNHDEPQVDLSITSVADLRFTTRVAFAEKILCKIAITKGLRKTLLTYHISHHEWPPETFDQILNPKQLNVAESTIFSVPCPVRVTATRGNATAFEQRLGEVRTKQMKEAWVQIQKHRPSTVQDFLLECITDMSSMSKQEVSENGQMNIGFLTSAKELCDGVAKKDQGNLHKKMRDRAATLVLEVHAGKRNFQLTRIVEQYKDHWERSSRAESETGSKHAWKETLVESLCGGKNNLKMTSTKDFKWKGGSTLNLLMAILTQSVFRVETTNGGQCLENDELIFQIIRQNGRGKRHHEQNAIVSTPIFQ
jgi:hypothetical protein